MIVIYITNWALHVRYFKLAQTRCVKNPPTQAYDKVSFIRYIAVLQDLLTKNARKTEAGSLIQYP